MNTDSEKTAGDVPHHSQNLCQSVSQNACQENKMWRLCSAEVRGPSALCPPSSTFVGVLGVSARGGLGLRPEAVRSPLGLPPPVGLGVDFDEAGAGFYNPPIP
jgi:hypothetical protein